ncbi:MAG: SufE family protein [Candidatus Promineifilaceae bacterium]
MNEDLPERLAEIVEDFSLCVGKEKLEYLLQFAESMPPLPDWIEEKKSDMDQVHECMTPVFMYADDHDGRLTYYFDVPKESPTVRGYAAIMHEGVQDVTAEEVLKIPGEFYLGMGLHEVISGQRLNGLSAILAHMKKLATNYL